MNCYRFPLWLLVVWVSTGCASHESFMRTNQGNPAARSQLGATYDNGLGNTTNDAAAAAWHRKAAGILEFWGHDTEW